MLDPIQVQFPISESLLVSALQDMSWQEEAATTVNINKKLQDQKVVPRLILSNGSEYPYLGEIYFIDNQINPLTGTINLRTYFPNLTT